MSNINADIAEAFKYFYLHLVNEIDNNVKFSSHEAKVLAEAIKNAAKETQKHFTDENI